MLDQSTGAVPSSTVSDASNCIAIGRSALPSAARKNSLQVEQSTTKASARLVGSVTVSAFSPIDDRPAKQKPFKVAGGPAGLPDSTARPSKPVEALSQRKARARMFDASATSRGVPSAAAAWCIGSTVPPARVAPA